VPAARDDVENVALPELRVAVPRLVVPFRKVTVPVGVPVAPEPAATAAVNVTDWPTVAGFGATERFVVDAALPGRSRGDPKPLLSKTATGP
jgi:hypothetical protein